jgi:hypothetical protein
MPVVLGLKYAGEQCRTQFNAQALESARAKSLLFEQPGPARKVDLTWRSRNGKTLAQAKDL